MTHDPGMKEQISLDVIVVGAGLAGLAIALSLAQSGHKVQVLESKKDISEVGAGIVIPPNASRILHAWGLDEEFKSRSDKLEEIHFKRFVNGEILHKIKASGHPAWLLYRSDFQSILYDAAIRAGVSVQFNAKVAKVDDSDISVLLEDGTAFRTDLVVISDGIGSKARKSIVPNGEDAPQVSGLAYRAVLPRERMNDDPELAALMVNGQEQIWIGPERMIVAYPIAKGREFNMFLEHPGQAEVGIWNRPGDVQELRDTFSSFEPVVQKLTSRIDSCMDWTCARIPALTTWTSASGRILLTGDAAHATTPHLAQGAAMVIEDAAVLQICLSGISDKAQLKEATASFTALRKERVERVQDVSWDMCANFTLPDGQEQRKRDQDFTVSQQKRVEGGKEFATWADQDFRFWLYGYDAIAHAVFYREGIVGSSTFRWMEA